VTTERNDAARRLLVLSCAPQIPRQLLREIMMQKVDPERVRWGSRVKGIQRCEEDSGIRIILEGGDQILADLVVGADGVRSKIRQEVSGGASPSFLGVMVIMGMASIVSLRTTPVFEPFKSYLETMVYDVDAY